MVTYGSAISRSVSLIILFGRAIVLTVGIGSRTAQVSVLGIRMRSGRGAREQRSRSVSHSRVDVTRV